jgi:hypothetical protein
MVDGYAGWQADRFFRSNVNQDKEDPSLSIALVVVDSSG